MIISVFFLLLVQKPIMPIATMKELVESDFIPLLVQGGLHEVLFKVILEKDLALV